MKRLGGHGRMIWLLGVLLTVVIGGVVALWSAPRWLIPWIASRNPGCVYLGPTTQPRVALTIDDGPDGLHTGRILDVLAANDARATFFLISGRIPGNEDLVRRMVTSGHELGNHLTRDEPSIRLSAEGFDGALREADSVLRRYAPIRWVRPGGGWYNARMVATIERSGLRCALGSIYPYDTAIPSVGFATRYILANLRPGGIVILHDVGARGGRTTTILERILPAIAARGYKVVTLSELVDR